MLQFVPLHVQTSLLPWLSVYKWTDLLQFVASQVQKVVPLTSGKSGVGSLVILGVGGGPRFLGCGASGTAGGTREVVPAALGVFF